MIRRIFKALFINSKIDRGIIKSVKTITGIKPRNVELYKLATQHRSIAKQNEIGFRESNERLEYLGDAILGSVVAEYLFKKYPLRDEGFLTEIRSRIVNRDALNLVAKKMGVTDIVKFTNNRKSRQAYKSIYGDTLEALIGAIYLDKGYQVTRKFIVRKLLRQQYDLEKIIQTNPNHKSKIIEWAHRQNKDVKFEITEIKGLSHNKEFMAELYIEGEPVARGNGFSKKKAEQDAALKSCEKLHIE
ncbi:MAG: ribonuclease III [Cyclobacteriaceae bacterium]|nr:ribonuclease III [Cyclobacteriaceae bacterium]MCK5210196.1 ribonuclease III [Cyclobacteriaceae bacterium]MCK5280820.1 ribonuclease III [Cyclobacteriaceae bacterium]MCK5367172.1 ribonuclease III [Cyclobacteriaceae bacterium]MCK5470326.1 ribonuclease III [Cyclobacteriaceae bacterium]